MSNKIREIPLYDFQPAYLTANFSEEELKIEYKRLEKYASARIEALERSKFKEHPYYQRFRRYLKRNDLSIDKLAKAVVELKKFEYSPLLSVKRLYELRRRTIEKLHEEGYTFVNTRNFQKFSEFMEYAKEKVKDRLWDSERLVKFYYEHRRVDKDTLKERFDEWEKSQE